MDLIECGECGNVVKTESCNCDFWFLFSLLMIFISLLLLIGGISAKSN